MFQYLCSLSVFVAVILSANPQHVLHAVEELRETVKLTVAEVNGSLQSKVLTVSHRVFLLQEQIRTDCSVRGKKTA